MFCMVLLYLELVGIIRIPGYMCMYSIITGGNKDLLYIVV